MKTQVSRCADVQKGLRARARKTSSLLLVIVVLKRNVHANNQPFSKMHPRRTHVNMVFLISNIRDGIFCHLVHEYIHHKVLAS